MARWFCFVLFIFRAASVAAAPDAFALRASLRPTDLRAALAARSVRMRLAQADVDVARAAIAGAKIFANPTADFAWGTLPVGATNPPNQPDPLRTIPSYSVGLSYTFDWLKRAPRIQSAEADHEVAQLQLDATAAEDTWALARAVGRIAVAQLKQEAAREMRADAERAVDVARTRATAGASSLLDFDRIEIERSRADTELLGAEAELQLALADCAQMVVRACEPFPTRDDANAFLSAWLHLAAPDRLATVAPPPALGVLTAREAAARRELAVAQRLPIPDVTVRLGYVEDQFVVSGNQRRSLNVSVALPLPLANQGAVERTTADAKRRGFTEAATRLRAALELQRTPLTATLALAQQRMTKLDDEMLPRARAVLATLQRASDTRLLPVTDMLQARRALNELLRDRADSARAAFEAAIGLLALHDLERS